MKQIFFKSLMKLVLLVSFLAQSTLNAYSQSGLNKNGQVVSDQASMINKYGAKGSGTGVTKNGESFLATPVLATLTTTAVSSILYSKASGGGNITNGGGVIAERGVVWSTSSGPTTALTTKTSNGTGAGVYSSNMSGLSYGTVYYARAYAINSVGTAYGNEVSFTTLAGPPPAQVGTSALCDGEHSTVVVEVTGSSGKKWMDRNLGASRVAASNRDYEAYGCLFQWGRGNDGHASITWYNANAAGGLPVVNDYTNAKSSTDDPGHALFIRYAGEADWRSTPNDNLWQGVNGINNPCPPGFRVPTIAELEADISSLNDVSVLKLTFSGTRESNDAGTADYLWKQGSDIMSFSSSTVSGTSANHRTASPSWLPGIATVIDGRGVARPVRCIKN